MLAIEEENSRGNEADVKVSCVNRHFVHIHQINTGHVTQIMSGF